MKSLPAPDASLSESRTGRLLRLLLLLVFVLQAAIAARSDSVTVDEFVHLPVGLYMARHVEFSPDPINPPLARMVAALPLAWDREVREPTLRANPWGMGLEFMDANFARYQSLFVRARCAMILTALLLGGLVAHWARQLYGERAALAALFLFSFSPSFLAHGHLVTVDVAGSLGFTLALYAAWKMFSEPTSRRAIILGTAFGIATLLKLSNLFLGPLILLLAVIEIVRSPRGNSSLGRWIGHLALAAVAAVLIVDLGYGFEAVLTRFDQIGFRPTGRMTLLADKLPWLRMPLPGPFLKGVDLTLTGDDPSVAQYYLAGEFSQQGWWYYHLVAFALKTPLPILIASVLALALWVAGKRRENREYVLFLGVVSVFAVNTLLNPLNFGVRHVLPAESLLLIAIAPLFAYPIEELWRRRRITLRSAGAIVGLVWIALGTIRVGPRYLEYFNELAGGPEHGHEWLIDSNLDWGQDLIRLSEYMELEQLSSVNLAYFGTVHPSVYGIRFTPLTPDSHGIGVISATTLMGSSYAAWLDWNRHDKPPPGAFDWLRHKQAIGRVGAMFLFELP